MDPNEQPKYVYQPEKSQEPANSPETYNYQENAWQPAPPPMGEPPRKSTHAKTIGLVAVFLAVAVLFSALTGGLVYSIMKNRYAPAESTKSSETTSDNLPATTETTTNSTETNSTDSVTNKHFSLADAASRTDGKALSVMEIAASGKPAVVAINTEVSMKDMFGQTANYSAAGSGFIISADGYIVTNNHVIADAKTITVVLDNGDIYDAALVGTDSRNDIAVIKIKATGLPTVFLGDSADLEVGELAVAIGNPLGELSGTVTAGIISALDREITLDGQTMHLLQTDAAINSGNSGGALFNSFGEVIGINTAKNSGSGVEGLGFAIPIDRAKPVIESLIQYGYVQGRPKIGITTRDITAQMAQYYNMTEGIYIYDIELKSAAADAGLQKEDIVIAADGKKMLTTAELSDYKDQFKPGDTIELTIVRNGQQMKIKITLKEDVPSDATPASSASSLGAVTA